jgi:xanthosine utilization system XapX-like protein
MDRRRTLLAFLAGLLLGIVLTLIVLRTAPAILTLTGGSGMYVGQTWAPLPGADSAAVRADIQQAIAEMAFQNGYEPVAGWFFANVPDGSGTGAVFDLEARLRGLAPGRFTFTLLHSRRGQEILHSDDIDDDPFRTIVRH